MAASPSALKFGIMADTQWRTGRNSGGEPGSCVVSVINALNNQFIRHGVKFVIQVGDLADRESVNGSSTLPVRAAAAHALYDAGLLPNQNASQKTDQYTLSMTYEDETTYWKNPGNAEFQLATRNADGKWVNAVEKNFGGGRKFVKGPYESVRYDLGTYGIDTNTKSVWAVIDHNNNEFAVARV